MLPCRPCYFFFNFFFQLKKPKRIFVEILPREWLQTAWNKKDGDQRAPNIRRLIKRFNDVTRWVFHEVMLGQTAKQRGKIIKHFIYTAEVIFFFFFSCLFAVLLTTVFLPALPVSQQL